MRVNRGSNYMSAQGHVLGADFSLPLLDGDGEEADRKERERAVRHATKVTSWTPTDHSCNCAELCNMSQ